MAEEPEAFTNSFHVPTGDIIRSGDTLQHLTLGDIIRITAEDVYGVKVDRLNQGFYVELCINLPARAITKVTMAGGFVQFKFDTAHWDRLAEAGIISTEKTQMWGIRSKETEGDDTGDDDRYIPFLEIEADGPTGNMGNLLKDCTIHYDKEIAQGLGSAETSRMCAVKISTRTGEDCKMVALAPKAEYIIFSPLSTLNVFGATKTTTDKEWMADFTFEDNVFSNIRRKTHIIDATVHAQEAVRVESLGPIGGYDARPTSMHIQNPDNVSDPGSVDL